MKLITVYDPTATDEKSRVRGVGRYFSTLKEAFLAITDGRIKNFESVASEFRTTSIEPKEKPIFQYLANPIEAKKEHIFLNPFFNPILKNVKTGRKSVKKIAVIHDLIPLKYPKNFPVGIKGKIYQFFNKRSAKKFDLIITDSKESKKDILKKYKIEEKKIKVLYPTVSKIFTPHLNPGDPAKQHSHPFHKNANKSVAEFTQLPLSKISKNPKLQNLKDYVIYVGDATWNKNLPILAKAIKMANITCVCVGQVFTAQNDAKKGSQIHPWQKSLFEFMKYTEKDNRFIFPGFVSDIELLQLYRNASLNILLSRDEGFGLSYIEAGFMSTPSILSDIPIFHEIAGDAAEFVPLDDPKKIAQTIVEVFYDRTRHEKMSIKAFDRAQEFHPDRFANRWNDVFNLM